MYVWMNKNIHCYIQRRQHVQREVAELGCRQLPEGRMNEEKSSRKGLLTDALSTDSEAGFRLINGAAMYIRPTDGIGQGQATRSTLQPTYSPTLAAEGETHVCF